MNPCEDGPDRPEVDTQTGLPYRKQFRVTVEHVYRVEARDAADAEAQIRVPGHHQTRTSLVSTYVTETKEMTA